MPGRKHQASGGDFDSSLEQNQLSDLVEFDRDAVQAILDRNSLLLQVLETSSHEPYPSRPRNQRASISGVSSLRRFNSSSGDGSCGRGGRGRGVPSQRVHPQRAPAALVTRPWACARTVRRASGRRQSGRSSSQCEAAVNLEPADQQHAVLGCGGRCGGTVGAASGTGRLPVAMWAFASPTVWIRAIGRGGPRCPCCCSSGSISLTARAAVIRFTPSSWPINTEEALNRWWSRAATTRSASSSLSTPPPPGACRRWPPRRWCRRASR